MDLLEGIKTRRSIRGFEKDKDVSDEQIKIMLSSAMHAPSAGGQFPWEFIVIKEKEILKEFPKFHRYAAMAETAPLGVVICGNLEKEEKKGTWFLDCSAACQNMLLSAHALGLGGVWVGLYPKEERIEKAKALLDIPDNVIPLCVNFIGYPTKFPNVVDRYNQNCIHYGKW